MGRTKYYSGDHTRKKGKQGDHRNEIIRELYVIENVTQEKIRRQSTGICSEVGLEMRSPLDESHHNAVINK